ncbi:MAG TPA: MBL fold metallo-hydrolase [Ignavibacteriales bacterium]|nr:MBL fold metallo-hydrolase [Ignavibacteriales bacterium]
MIKIKTFVFNPFQENTYILYDEAAKEAAIVDPGCMHEREEKKVEEFIQSYSLILKYMINTHCHIDHILANKFIKDKYNPKFYAPEGDLFLFDLMINEARKMGFEMKKSPQPDEFLSEDLVLNLGAAELRFFFTPGHSPGGFCIYVKDDKFCVTGDTLFREGIGRTDLWEGDFDILLHSISAKLYKLPDETAIYPGHGEPSSIGYEKANNPFIN